MIRAHTVEQVRAAEAAAMSALPPGALMQRAASGLAHAVLDLLGGAVGRRVLLLVGSGDNGGDTLWAGERLRRRGCAVEAVLLAGDHTHAEGLAAFLRAGGRVTTVDKTTEPHVVVDGIVGIGGRGPLRPEAAAALAAFPGVPVVAVDVPSGVEVDSGEVAGDHVRAALTVTFGTHKIAHLADPAAASCGAVTLVDLGLDLPGSLVEALQSVDVAALIPEPGGDAHKYTRGVVGLRTGSEDFPGAAVLTVAGASAGLAGMVRYVGSAAAAVVAAWPEVVVGPGRVQAWVVGSGARDATASLAECRADGVPVVVDAGALAGVATRADNAALVLTPHAGELATLLSVDRGLVEASPLAHVRLAAERFGAVVLLKGRRSLVARPDGRVRANLTGVPWLATAGSGDVLAGLVGSLLAAGLDPFDAAAAGAWLHGSAAAAASAGGPLVAADVAAALRPVVRALLTGAG